MAFDTFRDAVKRAVEPAPLSPEEMRAAMELMFAGEASPAQTAAFLIALRQRGETPEEIAAAAFAMRAAAVPVAAPAECIDTCGTGGDGAGTYNISTAVAFVIAGCGAPVAKHGNKSVSSKSGASEVLEALGVNIRISPEVVSACIKEAGVGFLFAQAHHPAMKHVAPIRADLGLRTMFNVLGPLTNPAGAKRQLMGVYEEKLVQPIAEVLKLLNTERAWVVHGGDGLDEITTTTTTRVAELKNGAVRIFDVAPEDAGLPRATPADLQGGAPEDNAAALRALLKGEKGPYRDIVVLNAAAALIVAEKAETLAEGARMAAASIDNGAAAASLEKLITISNG
ncbi:MAG: anthranilate phosphoribosyltransferase [Pseudomonadota bacterium]